MWPLLFYSRPSSRKQVVEYGVSSRISAGGEVVSVIGSQLDASSSRYILQVALLQADSVEAAAPLILSWLSSELGPASVPRSSNPGVDHTLPSGPAERPDGVVQGLVVDHDEQAVMISWNSGVLKATRHPSAHLGRHAKRGQSNEQDQPMVHMNQQGPMHRTYFLSRADTLGRMNTGCASSFRFISWARVVGYEAKYVAPLLCPQRKLIPCAERSMKWQGKPRITSTAFKYLVAELSGGWPRHYIIQHLLTAARHAQACEETLLRVSSTARPNPPGWSPALASSLIDYACKGIIREYALMQEVSQTTSAGDAIFPFRNKMPFR